MIDLFNYERRQSHEIQVGGTPMGGKNPIRLQSMTNTSTRDTEACVEQAERIIKAGGEYVRLTTQGIIEAENLKFINAGLRAKGYMTPLVADVHFVPAVADVAALYAEAVRINPGNYVDPARTFKHLEYTDVEYAAEIEKLRERFVSFLEICKINHTAVRIGVNHGSLSDRIMSRYGDTPAGMVESCMEFLRICVQENFPNVVISIKASNPTVMVRTVRLLADIMEKEGMDFPLHLGVTEAGDGEDGRIKSALGIGALLADGLGDTIRVSLSEAPEAEIPVARKLRDYVLQREGHAYIPGMVPGTFDYFEPQRRVTHTVRNIGGGQVPVVIASGITPRQTPNPQFQPDYIYVGRELPAERENCNYIVDADVWTGEEGTFPAFMPSGEDDEPLFIKIARCQSDLKFLFLTYMACDDEMVALLRHHPEVVVIAQSNHQNRLGELRGLAHQLTCEGVDTPVVMFQHYAESEAEDLQIKAAADMGALLIDGLCDGIFLFDQGELPSTVVDSIAFGVLQAGRVRTSKTEYIACPSCGRTLFDLQDTLAKVKEATADLKGLKIGVMGCIVNGPGEMADADYGYVGAGPGKVSLYRRKECVEKNIPAEKAVEKLLELIHKDQAAIEDEAGE